MVQPAADRPKEGDVNASSCAADLAAAVADIRAVGNLPLTGRPGDDASVLNLSKAIEDALGWVGLPL